MVAIESIIGGLLSGALGGVGAVEYRYKRNQHTELRSWYSRTERLAQRVCRKNYEDWSGPKPRYARATCAGVHSELASHISDAPPAVDEQVIGLSDQLVSECQLVKQMRKMDAEHNPTEVEARVAEAAEVASQLKKIAAKERKEIGFLFSKSVNKAL